MSEPAASGTPLPALAARAQLGDRAAMEALLRRLQPPLHEHIRQLVRDDDLAADILQESLIVICRRLPTVRDTQWVRAWAYRVATREAFHSLRRARRDHHEPLDDIELPADAGDESAEQTAALVAALPAKLEELPSASRLVIRMHYLDSLTQPEIAEALEIPLGTVKSRIGYGLMCLRRAWRT